MEKLLLDFIGTLDASFKKLVAEAGGASGVSRLTLSQLSYIDAVHALREPTLTELAEALAITKASVTAGVNKLVGHGYAEKVQSHEDRRVFRVNLTTAGKNLMKAKDKTVKSYVATIHATLTEDETEQLERILTKLVTHLKEP